MRVQDTDALIGRYEGVSDETLVKELVVDGDMDAFGELYQRYVSTVRGYLFKRIFDAEPLDDLVQDAFLEALKNIGEYHENPEARAIGQWLCGCAGRALRRERWAKFAYKKAANAHIGIVIRDLRDEMAPWTADPSNANADPNRPTEITAGLRGAIANLRPRYRDAIELHYLKGLTLRKTAEIMECTEAAVTYLVQCAADEIRDPANARRVNDPMDKWARLIQAAREVIDEVGVENATGAAIAKRAGLQQPHINAKFGSREGLIRAALGDRAPLEITPAKNGKGMGTSRGKLLEAARQIVAESGTEAAKANAIAERAGCSRRMITQNFGSLAELLKLAGASEEGGEK